MGTCFWLLSSLVQSRVNLSLLAAFSPEILASVRNPSPFLGTKPNQPLSCLNARPHTEA